MALRLEWDNEAGSSWAQIDEFNALEVYLIGKGRWRWARYATFREREANRVYQHKPSYATCHSAQRGAERKCALNIAIAKERG